MSDLHDILLTASADLEWMSEADFPFHFVAWAIDPARPVDADLLRDLLGEGPDMPVEQRSLDEFFAHVAQPQPWHDPWHTERIPRWAHLRDTLAAHLRQPQVWRVGQVRIATFLIGRHGGYVCGLATTQIET